MRSTTNAIDYLRKISMTLQRVLWKSAHFVIQGFAKIHVGLLIISDLQGGGSGQRPITVVRRIRTRHHESSRLHQVSVSFLKNLHCNTIHSLSRVLSLCFQLVPNPPVTQQHMQQSCHHSHLRMTQAPADFNSLCFSISCPQRTLTGTWLGIY